MSKKIKSLLHIRLELDIFMCRPINFLWFVMMIDDGNKIHDAYLSSTYAGAQ